MNSTGRAALALAAAAVAVGASTAQVVGGGGVARASTGTAAQAVPPTCTVQPAAGLFELCGVPVDTAPVGKLVMRFRAKMANGTFRPVTGECSGTVVGQNTISTARHCFEAPKHDSRWTFIRWTRIKFYPGATGSSAAHHPYGVWSWRTNSAKYSNSGGHANDFAFVSFEAGGNDPHNPVALGQAVTPAKMQFQIPVAERNGTGLYGNPEVSTIMGYSGSQHHDGNAWDLESCANVSDTVTIDSEVKSNPADPASAGIDVETGHLQRTGGNCFATDAHGHRISGSVIHHGASGGPWWGVATDGRLYQVATHEGAGGFAAVLGESAKTLYDSITNP